MSENELQKLKEQIKQELLQEMKQAKTKTAWQQIKEDYKDKFSQFNYIDHWEFTNAEGQLVSRENKVNTTHILEEAIRDLLRIKYKASSISKINASYEDIKSIVEYILKPLNENMDVLEG